MVKPCPCHRNNDFLGGQENKSICPPIEKVRIKGHRGVKTQSQIESGQ